MSKKQKAYTLSIIIPAYNEENYIAGCLDSIVAQSVAPQEVIVVDNNSTDNTAEIAGLYPFVKVLKESKQGRVFARNRGFQAASSDLIGRIDADTRLPKHWVKTVHEYYSDKTKAEHTITGGAEFYNLSFRGLAYGLHKIGYFWLNSILLGFQNLFGSNMVVPKAVLDQVMKDTCTTNDFHEDIDLSIHIHQANKPAFFLKHLRAEVALRGVWTPREGFGNRFVVWKDTLRSHGIRRFPSESALNILIALSSVFLGVKSFGKSIYGRLASF